MTGPIMPAFDPAWFREQFGGTQRRHVSLADANRARARLEASPHDERSAWIVAKFLHKGGTLDPEPLRALTIEARLRIKRAFVIIQDLNDHTVPIPQRVKDMRAAIRAGDLDRINVLVTQ